MDGQLFGEIPCSTVLPSKDMVSDIARTAANSSGFFKHQQKNEPDLTVPEKEILARDLITCKPATFLQRFGQFLSEQQLEFFEEDGRGDCFEVNFYLEQARQNQCRVNQGRRVKNRRYAALQQMLTTSSDHFTESAMRQRNPLLYEQLVGRFKTKEEKEAEEAPDMTDCTLSNIILQHMDLNNERDAKKRMKEEEQVEEFDTDEEDEKEEGSETDDDDNVAKLEGGRDFLRHEFVKSAYQSFLEGKDRGVDYSNIDTNPIYDDLDLEDREAEEKYFDDGDENDE